MDLGRFVLVFLLLKVLGLEDGHIPTFWLPLYVYVCINIYIYIYIYILCIYMYVMHKARVCISVSITWGSTKTPRKIQKVGPPSSGLKYSYGVDALVDLLFGSVQGCGPASV